MYSRMRHFSRLSAPLRPRSYSQPFASQTRCKSDNSGLFADRVRLVATGGHGGAGCSSFAKGPNKEVAPADGGCGGNGGDVWLEACDSSLTLRMSTTHKRGENGSPGLSDRRKGKRGEDKVVRVPAGTVAYLLDEDRSTAGMRICDLDHPGARGLVARGGRGGRGNSVLRSSTNRSPEIVSKGTPGERVALLLELKTIADVGLVGLPNAGKSTLLRAVSKARPRVANYAFTTLRPHIGVVERGEQRMTWADIPGLIDGAHMDKGLGHEFLRHIERTKALIYVVDVSNPDMRPGRALEILHEELELYQSGLSSRVCAVVANKMDSGKEAFDQLRELLDEVDERFDVFPVVAMSGAGVNDLVEHLFDRIKFKSLEDEDAMNEAVKEREKWLWEQRSSGEFDSLQHGHNS